MRRGQILLAVTAGIAVMLITAAGSLAATPRQIYADLALHGTLTQHYSAADLRRAAQDATIQGYGGVAAETMKPVVQQVAGAQRTLRKPAAAQGAPLAATQSAGALPFTGLQLGVYAALGLALLAGGLLLRRAGRSGTHA